MAGGLAHDRECSKLWTRNTHLQLLILCGHFSYYHKSRTHLSLRKDAPETRAVHPPSMGAIVEIPEVGGLHHHYERRAA
jgi:hypothetical protein